ncbi:HTH domain-containing protein [Brevibacillus nitrificans]|uniref:HTH domain-containing protein n=1 Tax=Brevibacillus nitrificans TaxID=651560 RepID=A0A3M8D8K0_9BACL|nr:HTH domain-containing protein [Brevibacillus nitrificans]RNB83989.1 HTH domain-containing protein [Brevibacillus nitrificans]
MIKIGVIAANYSMQQIMDAEPMLQGQCELVPIPYAQLHEIKDLYEKHRHYVHGILFSGPLGYSIAKQEWQEFETPTYFVTMKEGDFYKRLFSISNGNKQLDFSRVFIDFIHEQNNFMGLRDALPEKEFPHYIQLEYTYDVYDEVFKHHQMLWQQGKIDLSITGLGNVVERLNQVGIPNIVMLASKETIVERIEQIVSELRITNLLENQSAVGILSLSEPDDFKEILLHKALLEFHNKEKVLSVIQKKSGHFEVITTFGELKQMTNQFTACAILEYLKQVLPFPVNIGWGVGSTLYQAKICAQKASHAAVSHELDCSYVITENEEVIGPLGEDTCIHFTHTVEPHVERLSEAHGVSVLQIQKILAVLAKRKSNELTGEELAYHLNLTLRQANRILKRLEESGAAKISYKKQEKLKGRPKKVYSIDFASR